MAVGEEWEIIISPLTKEHADSLHEQLKWEFGTRIDKRRVE